MSNQITQEHEVPLEVQEDYKVCVRAFGDLMYKELIANHHQGGRQGENGWITMTYREALAELFWHAGKAQEAARAKDITRLMEFTADTANCAMILLETFQLLASIDKSQRLRNPYYSPAEFEDCPSCINGLQDNGNGDVTDCDTCGGIGVVLKDHK